MITTQVRSIEEQPPVIERYPITPSRIFNATRRPFLLGRRQLIRQLPFPIEKKVKVLEVGCSDGYNLRQLARWLPNARITGLDASPLMIAKAEEATDRFADRVELRQDAYDSELPGGPMDLILFSYSLAVANPHWRALIRQAKEDLRPGGIIAVVDFHDSRFSWLKGVMNNHRVRMDGHLLPALYKEFKTLAGQLRPAYGGLWEYFLYLGRKE